MLAQRLDDLAAYDTRRNYFALKICLEAPRIYTPEQAMAWMGLTHWHGEQNIETKYPQALLQWVEDQRNIEQRTWQDIADELGLSYSAIYTAHRRYYIPR